VLRAGEWKLTGTRDAIDRGEPSADGAPARDPRGLHASGVDCTLARYMTFT
jgi:hypothetical protein